jgi:hypothetical protein
MRAKFYSDNPKEGDSLSIAGDDVGIDDRTFPRNVGYFYYFATPTSIYTEN